MTIGPEDLNGDGQLVSQAADLGRSRPPQWAWSRRLVIGRLNLLLGNEGVGKGALIAWTIARLTRGDLPGDLRGTPVNVGIVGDEDDLDSVWTPRLHAAGAVLERVREIARPDGGLVVIGQDREPLAQQVRENSLAVLYFDQLLDNLGAGLDDWRQKAVRDAIAPLRALARELEITALGTLHPNKRGRTFRELVAGTPAFNAASRSSLLLAEHPHDPDKRVLLRGKGNLSERPAPLEFEIASYVFEANGHLFDVPRVTGMQTSDVEIDELLDGGGKDKRDLGISKAAIARELVESMLADGQWHDSAEVYAAAAEHEIDERNVRNAKTALRVEHRRVGEFPTFTTEWRRSGRARAGARSGAAGACRSIRSVRARTVETPVFSMLRTLRTTRTTRTLRTRPRARRPEREPSPTSRTRSCWPPSPARRSRRRRDRAAPVRSRRGRVAAPRSAEARRPGSAARWRRTGCSGRSSARRIFPRTRSCGPRR